ncbi:MAG: 2-iminoacetate synthase ThiH [Lentisphaeria bacterium]|nr:2-iminoacetate synthase ThiH [Lentisphaeria bacterium]
MRRVVHGGVRNAEDMGALLSPAAAGQIEVLAARARDLTRRHFGRTIALYAPLYLSNFCSGGCVYCGYAADRDVPRRRLSLEEAESELRALRDRGIDEVLLLTGERGARADYAYLRDCVALASRYVDAVTVEAFAMDEKEYAGLVEAGCVGLTIYQETYDPELYARLHRWGPKRDFLWRLDAPARALAAGVRSVGLGALLGLSDPFAEALRLYRHADHLRRSFWRGGISVSFPRLRPEPGGFDAPCPVSDRDLARIVFAFRIALPDVPLVLSTRESPRFRDGMAGIGISKMSVASRTTVGGYAHGPLPDDHGQFRVSDERTVPEFCRALRERGLDPVFKNWDMVFRGPALFTERPGSP